MKVKTTSFQKDLSQKLQTNKLFSYNVENPHNYEEKYIICLYAASYIQNRKPLQEDGRVGDLQYKDIYI